MAGEDEGSPGGLCRRFTCVNSLCKLVTIYQGVTGIRGRGGGVRSAGDVGRSEGVVVELVKPDVSSLLGFFSHRLGRQGT